MTDTINIGPLQFERDGNELFVNRLADPNDPDGDGDHIGTCELLRGDWDGFVDAFNKREDAAVRLLGFALFNHAKGNTQATETLMRKAYKALAGMEWDA